MNRQLLKRSQFLTTLVAAFRKIPADISTVRRTFARSKQTANYFASNESRKLHIGCGKNILPGWLNCDYSPASSQAVYLDATAPFPFADASFAFVFSEHMIEHVPYAAGQSMLRECLRVLKPGGKIRISTPNLRNITSLLCDPATPEKEQYVKTSMGKYLKEHRRYLPGFVVNNFYWDFMHYFIYDPETLPHAFESAGFSSVQQMTSGVGSVQELSGLECHAKVVNPKLDEFESMIFEATKGA